MKKSNMIHMLEVVSHNLYNGWTQGAMARLENDEPTSACDPDAVSWCLRGACYRAAFEVEGNSNSVNELIDIIGTYLIENTDSDTGFLMHYNDHPDRTEDEILNVLDEIIQDQWDELPLRPEFIEELDREDEYRKSGGRMWTLDEVKKEIEDEG